MVDPDMHLAKSKACINRKSFNALDPRKGLSTNDQYVILASYGSHHIKLLPCADATGFNQPGGSSALAI